MIRRILHELNVRSLARDVKRRAVNAFHRNVFLTVHSTDGFVVFGNGNGEVGAGYVVDDASPRRWRTHARLLTIGRITLAAWGGRSS